MDLLCLFSFYLVCVVRHSHIYICYQNVFITCVYVYSHPLWLVLLFAEGTISWACGKGNFTLYNIIKNILIDPVYVQRSEYNTYTI